MRFSDCWAKDTRIVEIDAPNGALATALTKAGYKQFLSVSRDRRRHRAIAACCPQFRERITCVPSPRVIRQNNADVLILHGWAALRIALFRNVRHARCVAIPSKFTPLAWLAVTLCVCQFLVGRLTWPAVLKLRTGRDPETKLIAFKVRRPRPHAVNEALAPVAVLNDNSPRHLPFVAPERRELRRAA